MQKKDIQLQLKISEKIPDPYPWDTVTILKKDLELPHYILKGWLLSEIELRSSDPETLESLLSRVYLAWDSGIPNARTLAGLFSKAIADKTLLSSEPEIYPKFFRFRLDGLKNSEDLLAQLFYEASESLLNDDYKETSGKAEKIRKLLYEMPLDPVTRFRHLIDLLLQERLFHSDEALPQPLIYGSISEATPSLAVSSDEIERLIRSLLALGATPSKLKMFWKDACLCLTSSIEFEDDKKKFDDYIKQNTNCLRNLAVNMNAKLSERMHVTDRLVMCYLDELKKIGQNATLEDRIRYQRHIEEAIDSMKGRYIKLTETERKQLLRLTTKLYMSKVFLETAHELKGFRSLYMPPPVSTWSLGDSIKTLSIQDTYRAYGMFIPGIFSIKRWVWSQKKQFANVCILMDASGSTAIGNKIDSVREAVFCLIEACRFGSDSVTFIPFSTEVNLEFVKMHSKDYETIEDYVISIEPLGYTKILPALLFAVKAAEDSALQTTFIFTDGGVWDGGFAQGLLEVLASYGKVSVFLIGDKIEYLHDEGQALASAATLYDISPNRSLAEAALNEYFNK